LRGAHDVVIINDNKPNVNKSRMTLKRPEALAKQARERIARIKKAIAEIEYLCTGTLLERTKKCGRPNCACATDPAARHGPYFEWGHMRSGRLVHRQISAQHADSLRLAISNHRLVKELLQEWEIETEKLIEAEQASQD
jgi:hypothetical protein